MQKLEDHHQLLKKYKHPMEAHYPYTGQEVYIENVFKTYPDTEILIIGPPKSIGRYFSRPRSVVKRLTMQGGFLPHPTSFFPAKFFGRKTVPTFNMNGGPQETLTILASPDILERSFVGKNVCHTVTFDYDKLSQMTSPPNRASELFVETSLLYFEKHADKNLHDVLASYMHLKPSVGRWVKGKPFRLHNEWGTTEGCDNVLADFDRTIFWENLNNWKI